MSWALLILFGRLGSQEPHVTDSRVCPRFFVCVCNKNLEGKSVELRNHCKNEVKPVKPQTQEIFIKN